MLPSLLYPIFLPQSLVFWGLAFVFGLIMGSLSGMLVHRLPMVLGFEDNPKQLSLFFPRSHCPKCQKPILWFYNLPIIGFCLQKGRCIFCSEKINPIYLLLELSCGLWFFLSYFYSSTLFEAIYLSVWGFLLITMVPIDQKTLILPDELNLFSLLWATTGAFLLGFGEASALGALFSSWILLLVSFLGALLARRRALGFGDIKLFASIGAVLGILGALWVLFLAAIFGLIFQGIVRLLKLQKKEEIPFAPYLITFALLFKILGFWFPSLKFL